MSSPEVKMTNPPKTQVKMVKIRAKQAIRLNRPSHDENGHEIMGENIVSVGQVVEVTESEAKEFCDKEFNMGHRDVFGSIDPRSTKPVIVRRAERV